MNYWLDLFTGTTWDEFQKAGAAVTGFRQHNWKRAQNIKPGDIFLCYNYHNDPDNMRLGRYTKMNSLADFWGKKDHLEKIQNMDVDKVCKAPNACNCRFKNYQIFLERVIMNYESEIDELLLSKDDDPVSKFL